MATQNTTYIHKVMWIYNKWEGYLKTWDCWNSQSIKQHLPWTLQGAFCAPYEWPVAIANGLTAYSRRTQSFMKNGGQQKCLDKALPGGFFFHFSELFIFWAVRGEGWKGNELSKMKNNNYICRMLYLRNGIAYHDFCCTCVKWWYLQAFFHLFEIFIFWAVRGVKGKSITQNEK